jgi:peptidoglycan hydrolase-like protein with peptidoglycan-binding domain
MHYEIINTSVGEGGVNRPQEVGIVQHMLNLARAQQGVPSITLKVDGLVGPKTIQAIREFQERFCKIVDGRVDPYQETIQKLNEIGGHLSRLNDGVSYLQPKTKPMGIV